MWAEYWSSDYWSDDYWNKAAGVAPIVPEVSPDCIHDWNIEDVVLEASTIIIIEQMTLTSSVQTPTGDNDWTI